MLIFLLNYLQTRITREIEQVICTDEGSHALLLCADGGVVYYCAPAPAARNDGGEAQQQGEGDVEGGTGSVWNGTSALLELPDLFRQKDVQQHTGSWALRRVGRQGLVVRNMQVLFSFTRDVLIVPPLTICTGPAESLSGVEIKRSGGGGAAAVGALAGGSSA